MPNVYTQLRAEQVADRLGISLSTFNRLIKTETSFPKPIKYSSRWVAWFELEVNDWILRKAAEQRGVEPEVLLSHLREIAPQSEQQSEQFNQIGAA
ncbi:AlpA family phage regulatory protein [uncultured Parasutterella sp.]|uniref:helix-turn-helix transcriptional regulator n=1 Tax=uncultured Parasutterella sp. TaxID=1263098 RepID=UPI0025B39BCB|nr:AlpA family phage regulatory protein [uncultured Parasutterella sp.]